MNAIEKAKAVVASLEGQLADVTNKATAAATQRRRLAFNAHGCGDEEARAELSVASAASAALAIDAENLRSAIEDAKRHVVEAEREAEAAKKRKVAREAQKIIAEAERFCAAMASGLDQVCEGFAAFSDCLQKLERLEYPVTRDRLRFLAYSRSVGARLRQAGLSEADVVPPYLRHDLASLHANYLQPSCDKVAEDLGEAVAPAEAA
jgi:hypothetical protein